MDNKNLRRAIHYTQQYLRRDSESKIVYDALDLLHEEMVKNTKTKKDD